MNYERESYMRAQDAHHDMLRMRDPAKSVFARTPPVDRNAKRQDPQGLGPKDKSDGARSAGA
ncbi:MAG: hypothetical protein JWN66_4946 [Sphingomonas bacterium]|uniref:hypothetical protein n=1 Tax=Sphingomonas bacterium TaxID=1895847 RepID=UPI002636DDAC|nr:hypothetical protein [Sphingomonas bacterium]MDB5707830.1 hypothetical protein [Sphingomonas bacterium]